MTKDQSMAFRMSRSRMAPMKTPSNKKHQTDMGGVMTTQGKNSCAMARACGTEVMSAIAALPNSRKTRENPKAKNRPHRAFNRTAWRKATRSRAPKALPTNACAE